MVFTPHVSLIIQEGAQEVALHGREFTTKRP